MSTRSIHQSSPSSLSKSRHRLFSTQLPAALLMGAMLTVAGCKKDEPAPVTAQPGTASTPAQPTTDPSQNNTAPLGDNTAPAAAAPVAPAPAAPARAAAPAPAPAAPVVPQKVTYTVPSGTPFTVRLAQSISAKTAQVGQSFSGSLTSSLTSKGVTVVPAGTEVEGTVTAAKGKGRFKGAGDLAIQIIRIGEHTVTSNNYLRQEKGKGKRTAGFIGGGAGAGALIGGLAGGGKGALIGALAGGGAGTAGAMFTGNKDIVISAETPISFTLSTPISITK